MMTNFHDKRMSKNCFHGFCLLLISIGYVFDLGKNYYPQVSSEQCKQVAKKKKISKFLNDELEISINLIIVMNLMNFCVTWFVIKL